MIFGFLAMILIVFLMILIYKYKEHKKEYTDLIDERWKAKQMSLKMNQKRLVEQLQTQGQEEMKTVGHQEEVISYNINDWEEK